MARRDLGRDWHRRPVRDRQVRNRLLHRQAGAGIDLWRVGFDRDRADLGLLLRPDCTVRRRVHPRLGTAAQVGTRTNGQAGKLYSILTTEPGRTVAPTYGMTALVVTLQAL